MAAEWTFNVSYHPFLIAVYVDPANVTHDEILAAGEFGVNLLSEGQGAAMRFAGHFSKADTEKLSSEAFETYPAKRIRAPMIRGSLLAAECRLVQQVTMGDHTAFIGEVLEFDVDPAARPLILHHGSHRLGERIERRPGVVLAATPARVRAGRPVKIDAELSVPYLGLWTVALVSVNGTERLLGNLQPEGEESFEIAVVVPEDVPPGTYTVLARGGDLLGRAHLEIVAA
jgi:flavin reductase (DIM6/NTAB) family NADH-FMN oxidoreductase RutF